MGIDRMNQLYKSVIFDHSMHPRNFGSLDNCTGSVELRNPSCGDIIKVFVNIEDDVIKDIKYTCVGCTISKASTSIMSQEIKGKNVDDAKKIIKAFSDNIIKKDIDDDDKKMLGDARLLSDLAKFPTRIRCATLGWHATDKLINDYKGVISYD
ncbi:SUF system NifU family Fe-S cluster assembly protein [Lactobacillus sp. B3795]|uniref:SUF system FeS assembly protein, NifU family n=1 Tax=Apilactobacillus kunkeei TaxID=148814 RepID=A0A0M9DCV2_9LACO|nr:MULTISPECIES: SUF system NifU family Fe-S cluster assembly protein [Lactobacillaceae]KOY77043.1 SUF system FeS assembly protein, NifU family [Apilactobacillus kunkeei]MCT6858647.1 SUF system NifU family Fe-S cluster assembly protein [Apilactobacillus sp.]MCX8743764.1 SUF system NifU family Fe-S cluster assembly protein [Lactobacillus sp. B3795]